MSCIAESLQEKETKNGNVYRLAATRDRLVGLWTAGMDQEFTDKLLKSLIEQMAKEGLVKLATGEAVLPP